MSRRSKLSRRGSKKLFKKTVGKTKKINLNTAPMRGGFRL